MTRNDLRTLVLGFCAVAVVALAVTLAVTIGRVNSLTVINHRLVVEAGHTATTANQQATKAIHTTKVIIRTVPGLARAITGKSGSVGARGTRGAQGPRGVAGTRGVRGPEGAIGPTGATGQDGATTQGPQGETGPAGPAGADGATGPIGPTGPAGADGAPGATGSAGPPGPGVTVTQLPVGSPQCPLGGTLFTDSAGATSVTCSG